MKKKAAINNLQKPERRGIDLFGPFKKSGLVMFAYKEAPWEWLSRLLARVNLRGKIRSGIRAEGMKRTQGLVCYNIDYDKYSHDPIAAEGLIIKFFLIFLRVVKGHLKARRDYRRTVRALPAKSPNADGDFWVSVREKAESLGIGLIGFAPVDDRFIFTKDYTMGIEMLYENAIVLGMEMKREKIDTAPGAAAGLEAMRVYAELGLATNRLADFVRSKGFRAIACHPLGGPILYPAMAVRAGLGEMGKNGLLITEEYGPRQRLALIATDAGPLPDEKHVKLDVMEYCKSCLKCVKACPNRAIFPKPVVSKDGLHQTHIDTDRCLPFFYKYAGCSI